MKTCVICGEQNMDTANFCMKCGNKFENEADDELNNTISWSLLDTPEKIKRAVENSFPSQNGLKWTEILFLSYTRSFHIGQTEFPSFWYESYGIDNPDGLLQSLLDRGFIRVASNETALNRLTIPELKDVLRQQNLKLTGKKSDLIDRILQNVDAEFLDQLLTFKGYELTKLGESELKQNKYVLDFNYQARHYGVDVWWVNRQLHKYPHMNYHDLIWGELNRQAIDAMKESANGQFDSYIKNREDMVMFLLSERKNYQQALTLLCEAYFYKANITSVRKYLKYKKEYDYFNSVMENAEYPMEEPCFSKLLWIDKKSFVTIRNGIGISNDDLFGLIINNLNLFHCSNPVIDNQNLAGIIVASIEGNTDLVNSVFLQIEMKLNKCKS